MVSLTEQVRLRAAVEELTSTPNTWSATGATEDSVSTSREPGGTGVGERKERKRRRKSNTRKSVSYFQFLSIDLEWLTGHFHCSGFLLRNLSVSPPTAGVVSSLQVISHKRNGQFELLLVCDIC